MKIINKQHGENFIRAMNPENTLWVFDFDATLALPGYDSVKIIKDAHKDGELEALNSWMFLLYEANSYYELFLLEEKNIAKVPAHIVALSKTMDFAEFKQQQMDYWRDFTLDKAVERNVPVSGYDTSKFTERTGAINLIHKLLEQKYYVLVLSAGIKNIIVETLKSRGIDTTNEYIRMVSNELYGNENNETIKYNENLITCFSKNKVDYKSLGIPEKTQAIQLGDSYTDANMMSTTFERDKLLNIGFSNQNTYKTERFQETFDIVVESDVGGFEEILEVFF